MARLVLSDASPLIALARVGGVPWLRALFGRVAIPETVRAEVLDCGAWPGQAAIRNALEEGWLFVLSPSPDVPRLPDLDEGEAECIRLALANAGPVLILMDERAGRAIAAEHGLRVAGTAAVIGMARTRGLIPSTREVFEDLMKSDFRIAAEVVRAVLSRVGE